MKLSIVLRIIALSVVFDVAQCHVKQTTKSIEELAIEYEDDKNSMIAITEQSKTYFYEDFYDEMDNSIIVEPSMDMIYFGPPSAFMRLDAESILHLLINTNTIYIPISTTLLAWDIVTDGKTAAFLQGRDLLAFGTLLNVVPEEDLYYLNFGDPSVLKYFSSRLLKLHKRKFGVLVAAYRRYYGTDWYKNSTYINELGYLFCGFASSDLEKIAPEIFRDLNVDVLGKLNSCDVNQTKTLYNIATHPDAYGEPYKWSSHEVSKLDTLFACISKEDISSLQLEAMSAISPQVMRIINQAKLEYFTEQQILRMNSETRHMYILRMQLRDSLDMTQIAKSLAILIPYPTIFVNIVILLLLFGQIVKNSTNQF